jgi:hypothetical protein
MDTICERLRASLEILDELITVSDMRCGGTLLGPGRRGLVHIDEATKDSLKQHIKDVNSLLKKREE